MIFVCLLRIVGPLPPVLISRYAKNHSPDDFCLRHSTFYIMHSALFCRFSGIKIPCIRQGSQQSVLQLFGYCLLLRSFINPSPKDFRHYAFCILHSTLLLCILHCSAVFPALKFTAYGKPVNRVFCNYLQLFAVTFCNFFVLLLIY